MSVESKRYTLEEAQNEAELLKKKVESGEVEDYNKAEDEVEEEYFKMLLNLDGDYDYDRVRDYLDNKIPAIYHKNFALRLIGSDKKSLFTSHMDHYRGLDKEVAMKLITSGNTRLVVFHIDCFPKSDHSEITKKLIEFGGARDIADRLDEFPDVDHKMLEEKIFKEQERGEYIARNLQKFIGIDHAKLAKRMMENGEFEAIARNIHKFENFDQYQFGLILIKKGLINVLADNLYHFKDGIFDKNIAEKLIEAGYTWKIDDKLTKFHNLDKQIAMKLITGGCNYRYLQENLDRFAGFELNSKEVLLKYIKTGYFDEYSPLVKNHDLLDKEIALALIGAGNGGWLIKNFDKFQNLDNDKEIALKFILRALGSDDGPYGEVKSHLLEFALNKFKFPGLNLSKELVIKIIESPYKFSVQSVLDFFQGSDKEILLSLIERKYNDLAGKFINRFNDLDQETALRLSEAGLGAEVVEHLDKFKNIDFNKELAASLIEGYGYHPPLLEILDKFHDLDREVAVKLIEKGEGNSVLLYLDKFSNLELDNELALKFIESSVLEKFINNLDKFHDLDREVAVKLIEKGKIRDVVNKIDLFQNLNLDRSLAKIIIGIEGDDFDKIIELFTFIDKKYLNLAKRSKLRLSEYIIAEDIILKQEDGYSEKDFKTIFHELRSNHKNWQDEQNITQPFEQGAEYFGYHKMFEYLNRDGLSRHDGLHNFRKIVKMAEGTGLKPQEFYNNILAQVQKDDSEYDQGTAHHKLNNLVGNINIEFENIISEAKKYQNIEKLQELLENLDAPEKIFQSWKNLKKYEEIETLLQQKEILDQLQSLKKEGKEELYNYIETLAFHPNISMEKVMEFWRDPESFLEVGDSHTPDEVQDRKKPSNYFHIPNLDLTAEGLRDALVEGDYDKLQVLKPLEIEYSIAKGEGGIEEQNIQELISKALGKRSEGKKGEAKDPGKLFKELKGLFKEKDINLVDYLKSENPDQEFPQVMKSENEIRTLLFDEKAGLRQPKETEQYRAKINLKSDPDGVVAGNDTACCMPFGSGKNNVYTFNPICSLFTLQRKTGAGEWRTVAQSVLTKDKDINQNIAEIKAKLESGHGKIHEVVNEDVLQERPDVIICDNIEVAQNFKSHPQMESIIKTIYTDFFQEYLKEFAEQDNLDKSRIPVGKGYTDALTTLPEIDNTFIPEAPVGYSDNLGAKAYLLDLTKPTDKDIILDKKINVKAAEKLKQEKIKLPPGVDYLTFQDSLPVAYIEGKAYRENESLMEYMHNMENALIAKGVNNIAKERPNMSLKYEDKAGKMHGYILAYEGKVDQKGESVVFVSDLASDGSPRAGGSLILGFTELYKRNYIDKDDLIPILAQLREKTSYQIITKQLEKLTKDTGMKFVMEELGSYEVGDDTMHEVIIRPEKES